MEYFSLYNDSKDEGEALEVKPDFVPSKISVNLAPEVAPAQVLNFYILVIFYRNN
jgi:hypothetical protein